jgi:hypothetical protein
LEERVVQPILISVTILNPTTETPEYSENWWCGKHKII